MAPPDRRKAAIIAAVRAILLRDWDPIGIKDYPMAYDEYDSYAEGTYQLLERQASEQELLDHLHQIATVSMGLKLSRDFHRQAVECLLRLKLD